MVDEDGDGDGGGDELAARQNMSSLSKGVTAEEQVRAKVIQCHQCPLTKSPVTNYQESRPLWNKY